MQLINLKKPIKAIKLMLLQELLNVSIIIDNITVFTYL